MMNLALLKSCFFFAVVSLFSQLVLAVNINNTAEEDINGQYLLDFGVKTNDPLLQAIGLAIMNSNHRHHHRCDDWTSWSSCTAGALGKFGIKERKRTCGNEIEKTEKDLSICRKLCPSGYDKTANGFCVKLHMSKKSYVEANNHCKTEGGYLISINSELKYKDISNISNIKGITLSDFFHIGGRHKDVNSPWMFEYGNESGYFKWGPGEPDNKPNQCLCIRGGNYVMFDTEFSAVYSFICEIIM